MNVIVDCWIFGLRWSGLLIWREVQTYFASNQRASAICLVLEAPALTSFASHLLMNSSNEILCSSVVRIPLHVIQRYARVLGPTSQPH